MFEKGLQRKGDGHTWVESADGICLIPFFVGGLRQGHWPFQQEGLVMGWPRWMTVRPMLKDFNLCGGCTKSVASNAVSPLVPDRVVS